MDVIRSLDLGLAKEIRLQIAAEAKGMRTGNNSGCAQATLTTPLSVLA